jgi:hypothetical protein
MQSRLTPSPTSARKTRRPSPRSAAAADRLGVNWRDAPDDHCLDLNLMAELLAACGQPLEPEAIVRLGVWLGEHTRALRTLLHQLEAR